MVVQEKVKVSIGLVKRNHHARALANEVDGLRREKEKLAATINVDNTQLYGVLAQALVNLKQQRPDLFNLTGQDQIGSSARLLLGFITQ